MVLRTRFRARRPALLGLVVAGLLLGLVGMHHMVGPADNAPSVRGDHAAAASMGAPALPMPQQPPMPQQHDDGHGELLHLCLAVLAAGALLAVGLLTWRRSDFAPAAPVRGLTGTRPASRAPPQPVPRRLALLCVLRT